MQEQDDSIPRYRVEVRSDDCGRFFIALFTPPDAEWPFFRTAAIFQSREDGFAAAEQLLRERTGQPVRHVRTQ